MIRVLDEQDRDRIQELLDSEGYKLLVERLTDVLEGQRRELEPLSMNEAELRYRQGAVFALRTVLDLPRIMLRESEPQEKRKR